MGKKDKKKKKEKQNLTSSPAPGKIDWVLSKRGWKIVFAGMGVVLLGFIVLTLTDPMGQNFASTLSPFLIIGGYVTIGIGILTPDRLPPTPPNS